MTAWAAGWAITQTPEGLQAVLRAADVGLTIPWSFAEDATGLPVRVDQRPLFWADARGSKTSFAPDNFPAGIVEGPVGGWTTDLAHKPSLAYPAYLATGEAVYARALGFEAAYAVAAVWPDLRGPNGVLVTRDLQLRSVAWGLRTIGNAAYLLPEDDPMKAYSSRVLAANMRDLETTYIRRRIMSDAGETEGYFKIDSGRDKRAIAPWQNDFMAIILAVEAKRGTPKARSLAQWMTCFLYTSPSPRDS